MCRVPTDGLVACSIVLLLVVFALRKGTKIQTGIWIERSPTEVWQILRATDEYPSGTGSSATCRETSIPAAELRSKSRHLIPAP
jgi:hypothetical protein